MQPPAQPYHPHSQDQYAGRGPGGKDQGRTAPGLAQGLGYYIPDCGNMSYKLRFRPNQVLSTEGEWAPAAG